MASDLEIKRFGRDLFMDEDQDARLQITATGDLQMIAGKENVDASLRRRVTTSPGELLHRAEYGAGIEEYVSEGNTAINRSLVANKLRDNLLKDTRIKDVTISVAASNTFGEENRMIISLQKQYSDIEIESDTDFLTVG